MDRPSAYLTWYLAEEAGFDPHPKGPGALGPKVQRSRLLLKEQYLPHHPKSPLFFFTLKSQSFLCTISFLNLGKCHPKGLGAVSLTAGRLRVHKYVQKMP